MSSNSKEPGKTGVFISEEREANFPSKACFRFKVSVNPASFGYSQNLCFLKLFFTDKNMMTIFTA